MKDDTPPTSPVHALRRRWKPTKQRLADIRSDHPTNVRFHRACSWLQQAEMVDGTDQDMALVCQWTAFNALYGRWDATLGESVGDRMSWRNFLDRILQLDEGEHLLSVLMEHKRLVMTILDDAYLGKYFWQNPTTHDPSRTTRDRRQAPGWYVDKRWALILECMVEHIYLLRCQLIHGAASHNSRLNRTSVKHCSTMLRHLLMAVLIVWIDHGANEDWGPMCYPPMA